MAKVIDEKKVKKEKVKKEKVQRIMHPALKMGPDGEPTVKIADYPADYDPKVHLPIGKKHFENEAPFLRRRAAYLERVVARLRQEAVDCETLGNRETRKNVKKLRGMRAKFDELAALLRAQGHDPAAIIGGAERIAKPKEKNHGDKKE